MPFRFCIRLTTASHGPQRVGFADVIHGARKPAAVADPLLELIGLSGQAMRVAVTPQGEGLLWHRIAVPAELTNVLVLDASYPIRQLCKLDPTLQPASRFSDAEVKRFDNVTVRRMFANSGRSSIERSFRQDRREQRTVSREVVEVVKGIPAAEAVLIFTFKSPQDNLKRIVLSDLRDAGIDVQAKTQSGNGRINVLTWGNETSLNDFAYCQHVILAGILHRSLLDIASVAVGQLDDKRAKLDGKWLLDLMESEISHCVFQALSRGSCREINNGQAKPMTAYVFHRRPLQRLLQPVMPGAKFETWLR